MAATRRRVSIGLAVVLLLFGLGQIPVGGGPVTATSALAAVPSLVSGELDGRPLAGHLPMLFIHHSVGGQLLADPGPVREEGGAYRSHPNGGGLRALLEESGYVVRELSYGSALGEHTDMFDWLPKFREHMDALLRSGSRKDGAADGGRNRVVLFKSCFPNSYFIGQGSPPGDPRGPELTLWNAKATLHELREVFQGHPDTLFVFLTPPPSAPRTQAESLLQVTVKGLLGRPSRRSALARSAHLARSFANWVMDPHGWLADYPERNLVAFDYFDVLTGQGQSDLLAYAGQDGLDAHPSREGQARAAELLVPFLNRAVRRAGIVE